MDTNEDFDPLDSSSFELPTLTGIAGSNTVANQKVVDEIRARREAFVRLAERFHELWSKLPQMTTRQVDDWIRSMFDQYMELAPFLGASRNGIPELRECCGKKRVWLDVVQPTAAVQDELGWGLGDIVLRVTRFFGFWHCAGCERRRQWLNRLFRRKPVKEQE